MYKRVVNSLCISLKREKQSKELKIEMHKELFNIFINNTQKKNTILIQQLQKSVNLDCLNELPFKNSKNQQHNFQLVTFQITSPVR